MLEYKVAGANEYLMITGANIPDIKLAKKSLIYPGQFCSIIDISPATYTFKLEAVNAEKLSFQLPVVCIIGPRVDDDESLLRYGKLLSTHPGESEYVYDLVSDIIKREATGVVSSMTVEQITNGNDEFWNKVYDKVQLSLNQVGLYIYHASIQEVVDISGVNTPTQAERNKGEIKQDADLQVFQKEKKVEVGPSTIKQTHSEREIEAKMLISKPRVDSEVKLQDMNSDVKRKQKLADVELYEKKKAAQAQKLNSQADLYSRKLAAQAQQYEKQKQAEAMLFAKEKEGEGLRALAESESFHLKNILEACGGDYNNLKDYLMSKEMHPDAKLNVEAGSRDLTVVNVKPVVASDPAKNNKAVDGAGALTIYQP